MNERPRCLLVATVTLGCVLGAAAAMGALSAEGQAGDSHRSVAECSLENAAWPTEAAESEGDVGGDPSLPLGDPGGVHIASQDASAFRLKYATLSATVWVSETVDFCAGDASLALDSSDNPHVAYTHCAPEVNYAVLSGTLWLTETVDSPAIRPSLAVDTSGNPHLSYPDLLPPPPSGPGVGIKYTYWTGDAWVRQGVDPVQSSGAPSLALDSSDVPHVAYYDEGSDSLKYAVLSGTTWISDTVDECASEPSLALDGSDVPHIAYTHCGPRVDYAVLSDTTWLTETVDWAAIRPSLAVDSSDRPHLAYPELQLLPPDGSGEGIKYAYWTGDGWVKEGMDAVPCDEAPSLALDGSDNPHVAYHDVSSNSVKYAVLSGSTWISQTVDEHAHRPSLAVDSSGQPHIAYTRTPWRVHLPLVLKSN